MTDGTCRIQAVAATVSCMMRSGQMPGGRTAAAKKKFSVVVVVEEPRLEKAPRFNPEPEPGTRKLAGGLGRPVTEMNLDEALRCEVSLLVLGWTCVGWTCGLQLEV